VAAEAVSSPAILANAPRLRAAPPKRRIREATSVAIRTRCSSFMMDRYEVQPSSSSFPTTRGRLAELYSSSLMKNSTNGRLSRAEDPRRPCANSWTIAPV